VKPRTIRERFISSPDAKIIGKVSLGIHQGDRKMSDAVLVLEAVAIGILLWGAFLCLGRRDRRSSVRDRRASARAENAGRRRGDFVVAVRTADAAVASNPPHSEAKAPERYAA
jgi:hypothetical protein